MIPERSATRAAARRAVALLVSVSALLGCAALESAVSPPRVPSPGSEPTYSMSARTAEGILAYFDGELRRAERLLRGAVAQDRGDSLAHYYLARAYLARGTAAGRIAAEETLTDLVQIASAEPVYLNTLAELRLDQGYRSNAHRALERLIELRPDDPDTWLRLARLAEHDWWRFQSPPDRALAVGRYEAVVDLDPDNVEATLRLAILALEADSIDVADSHVRRLQIEHPDRVETALLTGILHVEREAYGAAEAVFRRAVEELPGFAQAPYWSTEYLEQDDALVWEDLMGLDEEIEPESIVSAWAKRDPTPGSRVNERFAVHAARVTMANWLYDVNRIRIAGSDTAPGEFYIRYGKPIRREYFVGSPPVWQHTFVVDGRPVPVRFFDYAHNGNFMLPIEKNATPLYAELRTDSPETTPLERTHAPPPMGVQTYWFRNPDGEPRLEVVAGGEGRPVWLEASVADSTWLETYSVTERIVPRALPATRPLERRGVFTATLLPGDEARYLRGWLRPIGAIHDTLNAPLPRTGFAVSSVVLGVRTPRGRIPNPGLPYPVGDDVVLSFEVYGVKRDAANLGRIELTLSVIPVDRPRGTFASLFSTTGEPSYVTSRLVEDVDRVPWDRTLTIDTRDLEPGIYRARVEVRDVITGARWVREARFTLEAPAG